MGKFSFPSWCFSCTCFSSSSLPQEETIAGPSTLPPSSPQSVNAGPSTTPLSSQPSPQSVNVGPSTLPPSSPQSANPGPSTTPLSSQPSQQPANAGPSTTTPKDLETFLHKFNDVRQLHDLIKFVEHLLKIASGEKKEEGSSSEVNSYIQDGQTLLAFVDKHIGKLPQEKDSIDGLGAETQKVLTDLLKGAGKIHWVGAALSMVGFALARYNEMSNNQRECLEILKAMVNLGKQIVELNEQIPEQKQKLNEAVECIVVGCSICTSQFTAAKTYRFLTASVNAQSLKAFQERIDRLYNDLQLWGIIQINKEQPKFAPPSQDHIEDKPAVGIDSAREEVIRLLDLSAQHTSPQAVVVVVHGFGGIGKTTLADNVYKKIDLQSYKQCRIHMLQHCTENDLKSLQEQILNDLFKQKLMLRDCDEGRGMICSYFRNNSNQPLFLYIDNGLQREDLKKLLPANLGSCLPPNSRILLTTRNLRETDIFVSWKIERQAYAVSPLPSPEARNLLLTNASEYNDERNIKKLLKLCGGVPLLLDLIGSQLAISTKNANNIEILEMIREGEKVEDEDITDRMVDFVYHRLSPRVKEAFLDIASFFYKRPSVHVAYSVGEQEFRALEEASFVKTDERGRVIVHDIVRARGRKMSEGSRITDRESLLECLKDEEKLRNLKGIYFYEPSEQPPIEINEYHLNCMSNSLRILFYTKASQITLTGKCHKPFKQLRYLTLPSDIPDLPMEFEKLEHLFFYDGPLTQGMSLYELPPTLRYMCITNIISSENGVANSKIPSKDTPPNSSLGELWFLSIPTMERLPDGVEKLTKLEILRIYDCPKLMELPSKIGDLSNLEKIGLVECRGLEEWPSSFGNLSKLKTLSLAGCSPKLKESLPHNIKEKCNI
ncbi:disease resistance protein TAO1 [Cryptomeria japonica]|uniref:disease resistance protein TAO1 n=1 Tax=Cryptomeria japonica TaxID=3369 RepID=UPI0027DA64DD|nr:disease resistance protein TAO1 [Cryptomeria japonica]